MIRSVLIFMVCWATMLGIIPLRAEVAEWGDVEVSVLTCSPGDEVYSLYGHTAVRVRERGLSGRDYVFNYGVFDFNSDWFLWRFVLGRTDYMCMAVPTRNFLEEYRLRGSGVMAQVINFSPEEARLCRDRLLLNVMPQNRVYRYNYLTCNCTTKVMDLIESCVDGAVVYTENRDALSYRDIMHQYTAESPWAQEGNDVLLGADVDTLLCERAKCFVPWNYYAALTDAVVRRPSDDTRRLVNYTEVLVAESRHSVGKAEGGEWAHPILVGWGVLALFILIGACELWAGRVCFPLDVVVMLAHGLMGCVLLFVFLFSQHPTLDSNFLVAVLNPLPLVALPYVVRSVWHGRVSAWHYVMIVVLVLFLLFMPWIPQHLPMLCVPLVMALMSRYVAHLLVIRKKGRAES